MPADDRRLRDGLVKLMVAYRLHFEEVNLRAVDLVRRGRIGVPKYFNSSSSMTVRRGDIRTKREHGGGTLYDIGVYCINAARYLFRAEPLEPLAVSVNAGGVAAYRIVGSKGDLHVDPAYEYAEGLGYTLTVNGKATRTRIGKRGQFAPQQLHLSDWHPA